jgi:hypothetical protein
MMPSSCILAELYAHTYRSAVVIIFRDTGIACGQQDEDPGCDNAAGDQHASVLRAGLGYG